MCTIIFHYCIDFIIICSHLQRPKVKCLASLSKQCNDIEDCCGGQMSTLGELPILRGVLPQPRSNILLFHGKKMHIS